MAPARRQLGVYLEMMYLGDRCDEAVDRPIPEQMGLDQERHQLLERFR